MNLDVLFREWRLKVRLTAAVAPAFLLGYFWIQRHPLFEPGVLPTTALDHAMPFAPGWAWVYESLYVPLNLVVWLSQERRDLLRFAWSIAIASVVAFAVFVVYPTNGPRPELHEPGGLYGLVVSLDRPGNAFPSLHAALVACTLAQAIRIRLARPLLVTLGVWAMLILYSTLTTKQHYVVDVLAGVGLGAAADWLASRLLGPCECSDSMISRVISESRSQDGLR